MIGLLTLGRRGGGMVFIVAWSAFMMGLIAGASAETAASAHYVVQATAHLPDSIYNDLAAAAAGEDPVTGTVIYANAKFASELTAAVLTATEIGVDLGWQYRDIIQPWHVEVLGNGGIIAGLGVVFSRELRALGRLLRG